MPSDHASTAAATTAGFRLVQIDNGAGKVPRFVSRLTKAVVGDATEAGFTIRAEGHDQTSQAAADAIALAAANGFRKHRYGTDAANINKGRGNTTLATTDLS